MLLNILRWSLISYNCHLIHSPHEGFAFHKIDWKSTENRPLWLPLMRTVALKVRIVSAEKKFCLRSSTRNLTLWKHESKLLISKAVMRGIRLNLAFWLKSCFIPRSNFQTTTSVFTLYDSLSARVNTSMWRTGWKLQGNYSDTILRDWVSQTDTVTHLPRTPVVSMQITVGVKTRIALGSSKIKSAAVTWSNLWSWYVLVL